MQSKRSPSQRPHPAYPIVYHTRQNSPIRLSCRRKIKPRHSPCLSTQPRPSQINGRPTQVSPWKLKTHIISGIQKLRHLDFPATGWAGYMHIVAKHDIASAMRFITPKPQGDYFAIPASTITNTEQCVDESKWKALKDPEDNFNNIQTTLIGLFEFVINDAYHTGVTRMGQRGGVNLTPKQILDKMSPHWRHCYISSSSPWADANQLRSWCVTSKEYNFFSSRILRKTDSFRTSTWSAMYSSKQTTQDSMENRLSGGTNATSATTNVGQYSAP